MLVMNADQIVAFLVKVFPQAGALPYRITTLEPEFLRMELMTTEGDLRPGGTVSGPVMMTMADTATYFLVLAHRGPVALAVTTSLNMNFMRKPEPGVLVCEARMLKLGKRLAVVDTRIYGADPSQLYAQAAVTYSLPEAGS